MLKQDHFIDGFRRKHEKLGIWKRDNYKVPGGILKT